MKTKILTLLLVVFANASIVKAGVCGDNLTWSYNLSTHKLTISGSGDMTSSPWQSYNSEITSVSLPNGLTSIFADAFYGCVKLTGITIPNGVTSIGHYAFDGCTGLTSINIPNSVTSIGIGVFYGCTGLTNIDIPNSVTSIGQSTFYGCTGLTSVTIGNSVTSIGKEAFRECTGLTSINIPNSVTSIGQSAFYGCTGLTNIDIPNSVTSIGQSAFYGCTGLTSINIPESVTSIGQSAFIGFTGLTSVTIPNSVTSIGYSAFENIPYIVYPGSASGSPWGAQVRYAVQDGFLLYNDNAKTIIGKCLPDIAGNFIIPNGVTTIGNNAFYYCTGLTGITIPKSLTSIGESAFFGCNNITSVVWNAKNAKLNGAYKSSPFNKKMKTFVFGNYVEVIPAYLCSNLSELTELVLPNNVQSIKYYAFAGCKRLEQIKVYAERVIDLTQYSFNDVGVKSLLPVYVPETRLNNYMRDTYWSEFNLQVMSAGSTVTTDVSVTPHYTTADVVWPSVADAVTYELTITSGGVTVCTLIFNAQGQLTSIAFHAPSAERHNAAASQQGFAFTVTGLDDGSAYSLTINAKDANGNVVKTFSKDFTTGATALESVDANGVSLKPSKVIENGRVVILMPDGRKFDTNGRGLER